MSRGTPVRYTRSTSIDDHVEKIIEMKNKSMHDPEIRRLAIRIVSDSYSWHRDPRTGKQVPSIKVPGWDHTFQVHIWPGERKCATRDDVCEIFKVWNFVVANCRYTYDPKTIDTFATAKVTLQDGGGDCDDSTIVFAALLESLGFSMRCRVISVPADPGNWVHIYPLVGVTKDDPKQWVPLDCTVAGYEPGQEWPEIAKFIDYDM